VLADARHLGLGALAGQVDPHPTDVAHAEGGGS
jgi:hypothetical protein